MFLAAFFRRRREQRVRVEQCADALVRRHGKAAWGIAYERGRDMERTEDYRLFHRRVRYLIERKLKMQRRVDTATRYLERA